MGLVDQPRADTGPNIRIIPTVLASAVAVVIFVVVLAFVARATADDAIIIVPDAGFVFDAGDLDGGVVVYGGSDGGVVVYGGVVHDGGVVDAGVVDAGVVDAGPPVEFVTVSPDAGPVVDGGPADVEGPPYDVAGVAAVSAVLVEICAKDGLRWDPSLGGPFLLRVSLPEAGAPTTTAVIEADGLRSPVLAACLKRRAPTVVLPPGASDLLGAQQVVARATLATDGHVNILGVDVVALP